MKISSTRLFTAALLLAAAWGAAGAETRWHDEAADTLKLRQVLDLIEASGADTPGRRIAVAAAAFEGTPYAAGTLEGEPEALTINTGQLDCTTFVETVMALARTAGEKRRSWHDVAYNLRLLRYRGGRVNGYASRLHYVSDWIIDNSQRGLLREVTADFPGADHQVKTLDFMSRHRDLYPALADDAEFERLKNAEIGYRVHRFPYIKTSRLTKQALARLREGDIVAMTTKTDGLDVSHMGIITIVDGEPRLVHASSAGGRVMVDSRPLAEYLRRSPKVTGIRVIRLLE